jgi:hypothetical protein
MIRGRTALIVLAVGVALVMLALYGQAEHHSPLVAALGLGLLLLGVVLALLSLRGTAYVRPHPLVLLGAALGVALHGYEQASRADSLAVGWLLWALVPYALALAVSIVPAMRMPAIAGTVVVLLFDLYVHHAVFVNPTSSTAALALVFAPIWNTLVFGPLAMVLAWLVVRRRSAAGADRS